MQEESLKLMRGLQTLRAAMLAAGLAILFEVAGRHLNRVREDSLLYLKWVCPRKVFGL